jgi:hypothetical protein
MAARVPNETRRILCPSARRSPEVPALPAPCSAGPRRFGTLARGVKYSFVSTRTKVPYGYVVALSTPRQQPPQLGGRAALPACHGARDTWR